MYKCTKMVPYRHYYNLDWSLFAGYHARRPTYNKNVE
jgi:hypothetical protein